jgi:lipid-A-disaccharide synthase
MGNTQRLYIIAGEASGDLHAGKLAEELFAALPGVQIRAWGGEHLRKAGAEVVKPLEDLAFMGFIEVVKHLGQIRANFQFAYADVLAFKPDALILVDYPGFNLRMAKWAHTQGIRVLYYISPQLWAWKEGRVKQVKAYVERMYCILPFEQAWYAERGVEVDYVGHPLLDRIVRRTDERPQNESPILGLLPGSRMQEIERLLPVMLEAAVRFQAEAKLPKVRVVVAGAPSQPEERYTQILAALTHEKNEGLTFELWMGRTQELLEQAHCALVASGTATLETALQGVPQVVCYKGGAITYALAKRMIKVPYISLVNLVAGEGLVKECIQDEANPVNLSEEIAKLWGEGVERQRVKDGYAKIWEALGGPGASQRAAALMVKRLLEGKREDYAAV